MAFTIVCWNRATRFGLFLIMISSVQSMDLQAQHRLGIQFRPGILFPTTDLDEVDLNPGYGFEISGTYRFMPHISAYAGWGWSKFSSDHSFAGIDPDFEETGYITGLQFIHPFHQKLPFEYFLKGGFIYNHIELENSEGEVFADSGHGGGFQVETGFAFRITETFNVIAGIKYQTLSRKLEVGQKVYSVDLNYLSVGVTIAKQF